MKHEDILYEVTCATDQGLQPRFVKGEPPSDADMANGVQKLRRRVIRTLREAHARGGS